MLRKTRLSQRLACLATHPTSSCILVHKCFIEASAESDVNFIYSPECLECMLSPSTRVSTVTPRGFKPTRLVKIYGCFSAVHVPHFVQCISKLSTFKAAPLRLLLHSDGTLGAWAHPEGHRSLELLRRGTIALLSIAVLAPSRACTQTFPPDLTCGKPHQLEPQIAIWISYLPISSLLRIGKCPRKGSVLAGLLLLEKDLATGSLAFVTPLNNGNLTITSVTVLTSTGMHTTSFTPLDKNFQVTGARNSDKP